MNSSGSYVYLASRDIEEYKLTDILGVADLPVRLVRSADVEAVVSTVDLDEFGEEALRHNLEDLGWLDRTARAHDRVVAEVSGFTTVAPLRLATILYDDARVVDLLRQWRTELMATLDRVQDCWEWSVKVIADPRPTAQEEQRVDSGAAYLQRRKSQLVQRSVDSEKLAAMADRWHRRLSTYSDASRRLAPQDRQLTGHRGEMALNGAYLVDHLRSNEFNRCVDGLRAANPDLTVQLKGPWPPYSFATLESRGQP